MLADVVVSASVEPEAFGRVMAEGGAMGKPVIASRIGAAPEIIREGETGWLVPPASPDALADALQTALSLLPEEREQLAHRARERISASFSVASMSQKTLAVYRELLAV
jgi:glycosyltransferase involved in cell wall biosynthesis